MSEIQETDKTMRALALCGGVIAVIESILELIGSGLMPYGFGVLSGVLGLLFAVLVIFLAIRPIHYTPVFLGILGIALIVLAVLIGGIVVLLAMFLGALT
ncbi:MAG: hypothetical protein KGD61_07075 [Candidatus Lokiarchaeota archaeon]|nr:hypothetical protein [Candidatus Lokiarchaeota archaeon]